MTLDKCEQRSEKELPQMLTWRPMCITNYSNADKESNNWPSSTV